MSDFDVLKDLLHSVYVTPEQRAALGRAIGALSNEARGDSPAPVVMPRRSRLSVVTLGGPSSDVKEEDERHALLGPCGAE